MKLPIRRGLFILFMLSFFISAPLLIMYSLGYRFNPKKNKIQSVGALFLDSTPKDVQIYVNGKLSNKTMPAKFIDLVPGEYEIRIEKEGFHNWKKKFEVESKKTTFADNIRLFEKSTPSRIVPEGLNIFSPSPNNEYIIYSVLNESWEELWLMDTAKAPSEKVLLYRLSRGNSTPEFTKDMISWSPDNRRILIHYENTNFILSIDKSIIFLDDFVQKNIKDYKWDNRNPSILYGIDNKGLYKIDLNKLSISFIKEIPITSNEYSLDYLIKNGSLYYFNISNENMRLERVSLASDEIPSSILELPFEPKIDIINHNENYISLINPVKQEFNLLKINADSITYQTLPGHTVKWNKDNNKILYYNDFELWSTDFNNNTIGEHFLITRQSNGIKSALWHAQSEYIIFTTNESLHVVELDGRSNRNIIPIVQNIPMHYDIGQDSLSHMLYYGRKKEDGANIHDYGIFAIQLNQEYNVFKKSLGL